MRLSWRLLVVFASSAVAILAMSPQYYLWPPSLQRCSSRSLDLNGCLLKATEFALSRVSKGLSLVGLNTLDPLRDAKFSVSNDRWPVTLNLEGDHMSIMGPSNIHVRSVNFDDQTSTYVIQGFHESLKMVGNYRIKGSILLFPLNSAGTFNLELRGALANHTLKLAGNVRDASHGQVNFKLISLNDVKVTLRDPSLGSPANRAINRLVNDNWKIISRALTPAMEMAIRDIYSEALLPLTSKYTVRDFFPDIDDQIENEEDSDEDSEDDEGEETDEQPVVAYSYYQQWK